MHRAAHLLTALLTLTCGLASGQTPDPRRPGPPPGEGGPRRPPGERGDRGGDWRGGFSPGFGRPPMKSEAYDKLPEEDKKRIREAMDRVWGRPEVIEARERTLKAHADLRDTIRVSLEKTDPEVAVLLKKIEPEQGFDPRQLPPMPSVDSAEFAPAVTLRLEMDLMMFAKPDRKDATKLFHQRLMEKAEVQAALKQVQDTLGEQRIQAAHKLRQTYREAAYREIQSTRGRPPGEAPKP